MDQPSNIERINNADVEVIDFGDATALIKGFDYENIYEPQTHDKRRFD